MDDLVKRLRGYGSNRCWPHGPACDCTQAADRIEALERQVKTADALAEVASECHLYVEELRCGEILSEALAAYRATKEGGV